ncbi:hypothetical protein NMG60_11016694 [Bertholletia excelsa]
MKGEYVEEKDQPNAMFAKLHQTQKFHHPFRECQTSEEADSHRSPGAGATPTTPASGKKETGTAGDGATIEVVRRPRGRPPGSKNKPKPPVIITRDAGDPPMSPYVLELPGGADVVDAIGRFCRRRGIGLCVLTASGTVANVTLRQPSTAPPPGATVTFHGRFDILSLSATVLPPGQAMPPVANGFTISLAGPQGQIVGGAVAGPLLAAGTVYVVAASFNNPTFHRLPLEEDNVRSSGGESHSETAVSGGGGDGGHPPAESCGMSIYSCHLPSDVIWAPAARNQPQPPHY